MPILLLLFPLPFLLAALRLAGASWRIAFLAGMTVCGAWVVVLSEGLSRWHALALVPVAVGWVLLGLLSSGALWLTIWRRPAREIVGPVLGPRERRTIGRTARFAGRGAVTLIEGAGAAVLVVGLLVFLRYTGLVAFISPPNNWDSMTYHMPRVEHFIQNRSIASYPTNVPRQVHMPPFAEWTITQTQILSGGDFLANGTQWLAMVGSVIGVSQIAKRLGAAGRGQLFAAVSAATVPMGIMQATSTQNDYASAFWLVCCVAFTLELFARPPASWRRLDGLSLTVAAGVSGGLALLTKGTAYVYLPGFGVMLAVVGLARWKWRAIFPLLIIPLLAPLPSMGFYARNKALCGNPFGPGNEGPNTPESTKDENDITLYTNERAPFALRYGTTWETRRAGLKGDYSIIHSNVVRGLADHFTLPDTEYLLVPRDNGNPRDTSALDGWNLWLSDWLTDLGYDSYIDEGQRERALREWVVWHLKNHTIDPNDPATNWHRIPFIFWHPWNHEDSASEPIAIITIALAMITTLLYRPAWRGSRPRAVGYALAVLCGLVLFSAVFKWQPWHTRLHLPLLVLAAPLVGAALGTWPRVIAYPFGLFLLLAGTPYLVNNGTRPLAGGRSVLTADRTDLRFRLHGDLQGRYERMAATLRAQDKTNIGIRSTSEDPWEYAFIALFGDDRRRFRFEHIEVRNYTRKMNEEEPFKSFKPDWIVDLDGNVHLERVKE